jgi:hypothetical protein
MRNPTGALVVGTLPGFDAIEFKAGPRQVVCAGSGHPNGKPYRWRAGTVALKDAPAIPDNLLAAITRPPETNLAIRLGWPSSV